MLAQERGGPWCDIQRGRGDCRRARSPQGAGLGATQVDPEVTGFELGILDELARGVDEADGETCGLALVEQL